MRKDGGSSQVLPGRRAASSSRPGAATRASAGTSQHTGLRPSPRPSFSTSKTKRAFHRGGGGGVGSNDEEGELDGGGGG